MSSKQENNVTHSVIGNINFNKYVKENVEAQNHPLLPQHHFRMMVIGGSGSGKTNTVMNLIIDPEGTHETLNYDRVYVYAKDINEPKYQFLIEYLHQVEKTLRKANKISISERIIYYADSYDDIEEVDKMNKKKQNLIIFDDFVTEKRHKKIEDYFIRGRKKNCSMIYITQSYTDVPKKIRLQCDYFMIFGIKSGRELINLRTEHGLGLDKDEFKKFFQWATKGRHEFALIDRKTSDERLKFRKGFELYLHNTNILE